MPKIKVEDLAKIREKTRKLTNIREGKARCKITVHMGTCGIASGAREIMNSILEQVKKTKVEDVIVTTSGCAGLCSREPMMRVELKGSAPVLYVDLTAEKAAEIFKTHVMGGHIVTEYALALGSERMG